MKLLLTEMSSTYSHFPTDNLPTTEYLPCTVLCNTLPYIIIMLMKKMELGKTVFNIIYDKRNWISISLYMTGPVKDFVFTVDHICNFVSSVP